MANGISITDALKGKVITRAMTDGRVLALETASQRIRITWEDGSPKVQGIDARIILPEAIVTGEQGYAG